MNFLESFTEQEISGWGRSKYSISRVLTPSTVEEIKEIILCDDIQKIIPRGLGRSYGSPAQISNGYVIDLKKFKGISLNSANSSVRVGAGVSFDELLKVIVPKGFFIPVSPGTRFVTIGGAIAADVHGKNHHVDGSFGNHVLEIKIVDGEGNLRVLRHNDDQNSDNFWATIGGMGLTE